MQDDALDPAEPHHRAQVVGALERVLDSESFRRAPRSREFLAYVVTETLAGRADHLSERTVGRRAFGRGPEFDGSESASVRVRASRVRAALENFYSGPGADESLCIVLPAGRYVPRFERRERPRATPRTVPGVAVASLLALGPPPAAALAASLSHTLTFRLAQLHEVRVIGPTELPGDVRDVAVDLGVSTLLDGRVEVRDEGVRVAVRLTSTSTAEVLWSADDLVATADLATLEAEDRWAREVAARLGDVTGLVVRQELVGRPSADEAPELAGRLAFFAYADRGTTESIEAAVAALDDALVRGSRTSMLLAMRAAVANACVFHELGDRDEQLDLAARLAREALALDGTNAHAHLVLGSVARDRGQWQLGITHAETALRLAPYHPSYLVGAGITLIGCGEWERGAAAIREGLRLNPGLPGHVHTWLAAERLVHADHASALAEASLLPSAGGFVWGPLYRAMALAGLGYLEQAGQEFAAAATMRPTIAADPAAYFAGRMRLTDAELEHLVGLVRAASAASDTAGPRQEGTPAQPRS